MEDARRPIPLSKRRVISSKSGTVFKEQEIILHIRSIMGTGDGEVVSFLNSDSSNRVDGGRLGHRHAQHT